MGASKLNHLRVDHLQKLYSEKLNAGLSRRTVQYIHHFLHTVLNYAVKWRLVTLDVADQAQTPKQEDTQPVVLTVEQVKELLKLVKGTAYEAIYLSAVTLGLRQGELLALDWNPVDFAARTVRVDKQLQYLPGLGAAGQIT